MRLRVEQPDLNPRSIRVWLDEYEITAALRINGRNVSALRSLTVSVHAEDITTVALELTPDAVEIDAESIAHLVAIAEASAADADVQIRDGAGRAKGERSDKPLPADETVEVPTFWPVRGVR